MTPKDEAVLLTKAQRGDRDAFAFLIAPYRDRVYATAFRLLGNHDDAAEVTQDAILRTFWKITSFHRKARFYTWFYRIALNLCYRRLDGRRREPQPMEMTGNGSEEGLVSPEEQVADPAESPREAAVNRETAALVRQALTALDPRDFQILTLREFEGLSYEEVAQTLQIPKGTVMSRLHRARLALAHELMRRGVQQPSQRVA